MGSGLMALWLAVCGCQGFADQGQPVLTALGRSRGIELCAVAPSDFHGLSDLTHTDGGPEGTGRSYWAVPEQQRVLVRLQMHEGAQPSLAPETREIVGIDERYDTESVTALGDGKFALGTETMGHRRAFDEIFIVAGSDPQDRDAGPLGVVERIDLPYALWPGLKVRRNEGLEGLCFAGNTLVAASESVGRLPTEQQQRYAPLGRYDMARGQWTPFALALTLPNGKISALQCRLSPNNPGHLELLAIERHYGVGRILHGWLPLTPSDGTCQAPQVIFAEVLVDFAPMMAPLINFEGIDWLSNGDLLLITDNHMGFVRGPTYLVRVPSIP